MEVSVGGGSGPTVDVYSPFVLEGVRFAGPYKICALRLDGSLNCVALLLKTEFRQRRAFSPALLVKADLRRGVTERIAIGVTAAAALAREEWEVVRDISPEPAADLPHVPPELERFTFGPQRRYATGTEVIHHAGEGVAVQGIVAATARYELGFERRATIGYRKAPLGLFVEAGPAWLPKLPADGTPLASAGIHVSGGATWRRGQGRTWTASVIHVRAFGASSSTVPDPPYRWTALRLGYVF
jgi:hypothetical protein